MQNLGAKVRGVDPYIPDHAWSQKGFAKTNYKDGLAWCNLLTFHCPLTPETENYFSVSELENLKSSIYLINTARGKIINEKAIEIGLSTNKLLGVAIDVFPKEPWKPTKFSIRNPYPRKNVKLFLI
jgi:D-3-phosphoglycerate dehydrogenase